MWKQSSKIKSPLTASNVAAMLPCNTWTAQQFQLNSSVLPFCFTTSFPQIASDFGAMLPRGTWTALQLPDLTWTSSLILSCCTHPNSAASWFFFSFFNYLFPFRIICGLKNIRIISLTVSHFQAQCILLYSYFMDPQFQSY